MLWSGWMDSPSSIGLKATYPRLRCYVLYEYRGSTMRKYGKEKLFDDKFE